MSDLNSAKDVLFLASHIIGNEGPIIIDSGVYAHNIMMPENEKGSDIYVLSEDGSKVTLTQLIELFDKLDNLVDELHCITERSYFFEGVSYRKAESVFYLNWGS
jgi:hypothetical protein